MYKSIKVRIYPNKDQTRVLTQHFGATRFVYNYFLNEINESRELDKTSKVPSAFDLNKKITVLKKEDDYSWLNDIHSQVLQQSASNLATAFKRFFGKVSKYPNFKSKYNGRQSIMFPQGNSIIGNKIKVPKLGLIKAKFDRVIDDEAKIKSCTISRSPTGKYYASVLLEYNKELPVPTTIDVNQSIGIDLVLISVYHILLYYLMVKSSITQSILKIHKLNLRNIKRCSLDVKRPLPIEQRESYK